MRRTLVVLLGLILPVGCGRQLVEPDAAIHGPADPVLILSGFNLKDTAVVDSGGFRVGEYHDFGYYSTVALEFDAEAVAWTGAPVTLIVKIGPVNYFSVTVSAPRQQVALSIACETLPKPHASALFFFTDGPPLRLTNLRVRGSG